jgi:hypothetical protein
MNDLSLFSNGDTDYVGKLNSNFGLVQTAIDTIETGYQDRSQRAMPNGYAPLGPDGLVPALYLPSPQQLQQGAPVMLPFFWPGLIAGGQTMWQIVSVIAFALPAGLVGSLGHVGVAPTSSVSLAIRVGANTVGSITIGTGGTVAFVLSGGASISAGTLLSIVNQAQADQTLADVSISLYGTRA